MMLSETQHGYGTHQWDLPLSVLTSANIQVREFIGSIIHCIGSNVFLLLDTSRTDDRSLPHNFFREAIHSIALPPHIWYRQKIQIYYLFGHRSSGSRLPRWNCSRRCLDGAVHPRACSDAPFLHPKLQACYISKCVRRDNRFPRSWNPYSKGLVSKTFHPSQGWRTGYLYDRTHVNDITLQL